MPPCPWISLLHPYLLSSLSHHVFVRVQEFATASLCSDLNPLYSCLTSMQIDRVQVFSCCSRLQSTHLGQAGEGIKTPSWMLPSSFQPPPRLSEILKLPCGGAELSFKSRPGSHEILPSHSETWLFWEMQIFFFSSDLIAYWRGAICCFMMIFFKASHVQVPSRLSLRDRRFEELFTFYFIEIYNLGVLLLMPR